jgi:hypothetical protein
MENAMKILIAGLIAATALTAFGSAANAMPHRHKVRVCNTMHHHRVCKMVWR